GTCPDRQCAAQAARADHGPRVPSRAERSTLSAENSTARVTASVTASCEIASISMSEELDVLKMVTGRLDAAGIPYMVTGSMALNYYAVPRMTRDVDVVAELGIADVNRVAELF